MAARVAPMARTSLYAGTIRLSCGDVPMRQASERNGARWVGTRRPLQGGGTIVEPKTRVKGRSAEARKGRCPLEDPAANGVLLVGREGLGVARGHDLFGFGRDQQPVQQRLVGAAGDDHAALAEQQVVVEHLDAEFGLAQGVTLLAAAAKDVLDLGRQCS